MHSVPPLFKLHYTAFEKGDYGSMKNILGVDIGGTKCAVTLGEYSCGKQNEKGHDCSEDITIKDKISFPTDKSGGPDKTMRKIMEAIDRILAKNILNTNDVSSIGISCGGPLDSKKGIIMSPPNLYGWDNVHIVDMMERRFGIKARIQNDANACALAEWKFGAAKGYSNAVFLTFGTGMGAGLILDGKLYCGANDMAGEIGHIRLDNYGPSGYGKAGSFEGFCSGGGIAQLARIKVLEKFQMGEKVSFCSGMNELELLNAGIVAKAAQNGDDLAKEIYEISGRYLGIGLSMLIDMLNPEIIIIGSIFSRSADLLWPAACEVIDIECLKKSKDACKIVPSKLGEKIGDYAALAVATGK